MNDDVSISKIFHIYNIFSIYEGWGKATGKVLANFSGVKVYSTCFFSYFYDKDARKNNKKFQTSWKLRQTEKLWREV